MFGKELTAAMIKTFGIAFGEPGPTPTVPLQQILEMFKQMKKGGTIFLPPGGYEIKDTLHIQQSGIAIVGIGKHEAKLKLIQDIINGPAVKVSADDCILENLRIDDPSVSEDDRSVSELIYKSKYKSKGGVLIEGLRCEVRSVMVSLFDKGTMAGDLPYGIKVNSLHCAIFEPYIQHCERGIVISQHQNVIYGGSIISDNPNDEKKWTDGKPRQKGTPRFCGIEIGDKATPNNNTVIGTDIEIHSKQAHVYFSGGWANRFTGIRLEGINDNNLIEVKDGGHNHFLISRASVRQFIVNDPSHTCTFEIAHYDYGYKEKNNKCLHKKKENPQVVVGAQAMPVVPRPGCKEPPLAQDFPVGASVWYSKLNKPIWSDGKDWRDANGDTVA